MPKRRVHQIYVYQATGNAHHKTRSETTAQQQVTRQNTFVEANFLGEVRYEFSFDTCDRISYVTPSMCRYGDNQCRRLLTAAFNREWSYQSFSLYLTFYYPAGVPSCPFNEVYFAECQ
jgi:hypothetical protein